jgi:hypothetical protein
VLSADLARQFPQACHMLRLLYNTSGRGRCLISEGERTEQDGSPRTATRAGYEPAIPAGFGGRMRRMSIYRSPYRRRVGGRSGFNRDVVDVVLLASRRRAASRGLAATQRLRQTTVAVQTAPTPQHRHPTAWAYQDQRPGVVSRLSRNTRLLGLLTDERKIRNRGFPFGGAPGVCGSLGVRKPYVAQ